MATPSSIQLSVRDLEAGDIDDCLDLARLFHGESAYASYPLAIGKVVALIEGALDNPDMYAIVLAGDSVVGYLLGMIHEHYFSHVLTCSDLGFYILPAYRQPLAARAMLRKLEAWAFIDKGAMDITLGVSSGIADAEIIQFYHRMGYARGVAGLIKSRPQDYGDRQSTRPA